MDLPKKLTRNLVQKNVRKRPSEKEKLVKCSNVTIDKPNEISELVQN